MERSSKRHECCYDLLGDAVVSSVQMQLSSLCGLVPLPLPAVPAEANSVVYASSNLSDHAGPLLLLVCGSAPGGAAGVWGRSLCINASLHEGAMFDYIFRAESLGWSVLVANPNVNKISHTAVTGSECPHRHLETLWRSYVQPSAASCVLVVAHSYGGPNIVHLLKTQSSARDLVRAIAFTDGGAYEPGTLLQEVIPSDEFIAASSDKASRLQEVKRNLENYSQLSPEAFAPPSEEVKSCLAAVGRNFVSSKLPAGTPIEADREGVLAVSAGHESHPSTTHSATEQVFEFLQRGALGEAGAANNEVRASL
eukprot:TRINITY_DN28602_c0_g1_i1.p1 TRINITY_DN28602_c0_g1~~TRINITY_DN28602_c0_g1_i1.p1  ORF type:complete len:310 (+),score=53.78 TRINITY_DN28602_c0_g1_i1:157-1086(+)